jgi:hypothetical protein
MQSWNNESWVKFEKKKKEKKNQKKKEKEKLELEFCVKLSLCSLSFRSFATRKILHTFSKKVKVFYNEKYQ